MVTSDDKKEKKKLENYYNSYYNLVKSEFFINLPLQSYLKATAISLMYVHT